MYLLTCSLSYSGLENNLTFTFGVRSTESILFHFKYIYYGVLRTPNCEVGPGIWDMSFKVGFWQRGSRSSLPICHLLNEKGC